MPLGWFFAEQWRRFEGNNFVQRKCDNWVARDRLLKNFANELPMVKNSQICQSNFHSNMFSFSVHACCAKPSLIEDDMRPILSAIKTETLSAFSTREPSIASPWDFQSKFNLLSFLTGLNFSCKFFFYSYDGAGQQCCYDLAGYLMMTSDNKWGGNPMRNHNLGLLPWNEANKIPTLSHWLADVIPFYPCCMWQDEQSNGLKFKHYHLD